jgi:hypothetical protein
LQTVTPAERRAALVARMVAAAEKTGTGVTYDAIEAALTVALEEAAKVARGYTEIVNSHGNLATAPHSAAEQAANEIEAAIRALIPSALSSSS